MRIGMISNAYPPDPNGVAIAVERLQQALIDDGHEVFVAIPGHPGIKYAPNVLSLPSIKMPGFIRSDIRLPLWYRTKIAEWFKQHRVEVIHTHDTTFGGGMGMEIAKKLRVPAVHTYHTMLEYYGYAGFSSYAGYAQLVRAFSRRICNPYDAVVAPSPKVEGYLKRIGVTAPVTTILNVPHVTVRPPQHSRTERREALEIPKDAVVFTTFGRVASEKNLSEAINVMQRLVTEKSVYYIVAGGGPQRKELEALVTSLKLQQKIIFTGPYASDDLPEVTAVADVYLFTSRSEAQPLAVLEAMSYGLPVVAIDDDAVDYILKNGSNGFKAPLGELAVRCQQLIDDPALRRKLSAQAAQDGAALAHRDVVHDFVQLYQQTIERYAPTAPLKR